MCEPTRGDDILDLVLTRRVSAQVFVREGLLDSDHRETIATISPFVRCTWSEKGVSGAIETKTLSLKRDSSNLLFASWFSTFWVELIHFQRTLHQV